MVVERLEFHLDAFCSPVYPPWQLEEDLQAMPTRMSVRFWKIAVTRPHPQIRQSYLTDGHDLVLAVGKSRTSPVPVVPDSPELAAVHAAPGSTSRTRANSRLLVW